MKDYLPSALVMENQPFVCLCMRLVLFYMHGNMKTLTRQGMILPQGVINNMELSYYGNQLNKIDNRADKILRSGFPHFFSYRTSEDEKYEYNQNGAMTFDPDKQARFVYNELNLPKEVVINNTSAKAKNYYTYTASGAKLRTVSRSDESLQAMPITGTSPDNDGLSPYKTTDYVGNFIYEDNQLKRILVDNGYIENGNYYFYVRDHLGNNRIVMDLAGSVLQSNQYYPFGLEFAEGVGQGLQPYKYNGKELDSDHNLNLYDYAARYMDPATPRFTSIDPMAEKYYSISPYAYVGNNPLKYIDPTGMYFDPVNEKEAKKIENNLTRRIEKLEKEIAKIQKKKGDIGDRNDRLSEMRQSKSDISDMRNNEDIEFRYVKASDKSNPAGRGNPTIDGIGSNIVAMYVGGDMGTKLHESRHGGDVARGTLTLDTYGVQDEVSAYRAQYSYDGSFNYIDASNPIAQRMWEDHNMFPTATQVNNINMINAALVNNIGVPNTVNVGKLSYNGLGYLYPPKVMVGGMRVTIPKAQWDNN